MRLHDLDFIVGLEKDYPSTVSTVVRTCGKLAPKGEAAGKCVVCERYALGQFHGEPLLRGSKARAVRRTGVEGADSHQIKQ